MNMLCLTPDGHAKKPSLLNNLGSSFLRWFEHSGDLMDIAKAISHHEHALHFTPDGHADKPYHLNNLGISLLRRFECSGDLMDIDKAISHHQHAVHLTPDGHTEKPACLNNLGTSFLHRFKHSRDLMDIDQAISHHKQAVCLTPDGHAAKPVHLNNLGNSFLHRFETLAHSTDLHLAICSFKDCAMYTAGNPSIALEAALKWARLSHKVDPSQSLLGYKTALSLLPHVAWLGQSLSARYEHLASIGSVATEAAAAVIASERPGIALEWLEQGRSIVWGQLLNLRTPVDNLRKINPNMADDLVWTSRALERASTCDMISDELGVQLSLEEAAQKHRRLAEKWDNLLKSVRMLPGFEEFLLPKKLLTLERAAESGPVVVINVHQSRTDALVLVSGLDNVIHIPLDSFYDKVQSLQCSLNNELRVAGLRAPDACSGRMAPVNFDSWGFEMILSSLWTAIVEPVLKGLAFNVRLHFNLSLHLIN
jgi:tetratricopeptide (TPR) repeat protein